MAENLFDSDETFPRLSPELLAVLDAAGERRPLAEGEVLYRAGDQASEFFVVLSGLVAGIDGHGTANERELGSFGERRFGGELSLMTGQPAFVTGVVREAGEAIVLTRDQLKTVISQNQQLGDLLLGTFLARRAVLIGLGTGVRLVGSSLSPDSRRLREFLTRNRIPHTFLDLESDEEADQLLCELSIPPADTPLVLRGTLALRNPTVHEVAEALNLTTATSPDEVCDTVVIGAGPAGLGAAVYAASEGLTTVLVDSTAVGGQASTSARIENYLGFPAGISGSDLAERASVQATRFGVRTTVPETVRALRFEDGYHVVELEGGERLRARTVVLATGAAYRRLNVPRLADFEGAGVYYAATTIEAQMCNGDPVVVVGGANSSGQAAVFLSRHVEHVDVLLRGGDLAAGMSRYLVDQVTGTPSIEVHTHTEVRELHGNGALEAITVEDTGQQASRTIAARALFVFIGAEPCTGWLGDALAIDDHGFVLTGRQLPLTHLDPAQDGRERAPFPLETSRPGVFAVGDVRSGSIKRVASAVGEGAMAVRLIHQYLATLDGTAAEAV
ncbi:MAG: thioredoxin reductase [Solirubrobacteraceae bacterium]|nr:thioredoxin reductase [Solirubrobacteraceae bacterium]